MRDTQDSVIQDKVLAQKTLVIGNIGRWIAEGRAPEPHADVQFSELDNVTEDTLRELAPTIVLSPLLGDNFDVLDVAMRLSELGFQGQYRAIAEAVPNRNMIYDEVKAHAPGLDFDLLMMPPIANDV